LAHQSPPPPSRPAARQQTKPGELQADLAASIERARARRAAARRDRTV
jgi:hypothetical protein